jgi:PAS domain-containing protein
MAALEAETTYIPWTDISLPKIACIWDWDVPNDLNHLDGPGAELFGVSPSAASRGLPNDRYLSAIHPDDVDDVRRGLAAAQKQGVFEVRYRIVASGQPRWVFGKGFCTIDRSNRPERFAGALIALD